VESPPAFPQSLETAPRFHIPSPPRLLNSLQFSTKRSPSSPPNLVSFSLIFQLEKTVHHVLKLIFTMQRT
jgi:hypothetical protein